MRYFIVKTDHHIVEPGHLLEGIDTAARSRLAVEKILSEQVPIEVIADLGDVADTVSEPVRLEAEATAEAYLHAASILAPLAERTIYLPGNHDTPALMREHLPGVWDSSKDGCSVKEIHGLTLIGLDLRLGPVATGQLRPETAEELERQLKGTRRCVIQWIEESGRTLNGEALGQILSRHREKVAGAFHGHLHSWWSGAHYGIPTFASAGLAVAFDTEPGPGKPKHELAVPLGYFLVGYSDHGSLLVRSRFL
jgi:hypothetical protein